MSDLFDYLNWRGDLSFAADKPNAADCMILSQFTYLPFETMNFRYPISVSEAAERISKVKNLEDIVLFRNDAKLAFEIQKCPRFSNIEIIGFINKAGDETQFSAITYRLTKDVCLIAFRGTDETINGWKENFNMGFTFPVPSQISAVDYFENTAKKHKCNFILSGHSKGGNLAVYAAAMSNPRYSDRIIKIYNYDGPGFSGDMLNTDRYKKTEKRIETFIPQSSVIGMLLEHEDEYFVVHSSAGENGLMQHDLYSWNIIGNSFVFENDVTKRTLMTEKTLKTWIASLNKDERENFVEALFLVISETKIKSVKDFNENYVKNAATALRAFTKLDEKTRAMVLNVISKLIKAAAENML